MERTDSSVHVAKRLKPVRPVVCMCEQRSPQWHALRQCFVTASEFGSILGVNRYKSRQEVVHEMLNMTPAERAAASEKVGQQPAVMWGVEHEADGVRAYLMELKASLIQKYGDAGMAEVHMPLVSYPGIVIDPKFKLAVSPDAFIGDDGMIEVKCPFQFEGKRHKDFYTTIPPYQMAQVRGQLGVCQRKWCDHVQWTPTRGIRITRVHHDEEEWQKMKAKLEAFYDEHDTLYYAPNLQNLVNGYPGLMAELWGIPRQ